MSFTGTAVNFLISLSNTLGLPLGAKLARSSASSNRVSQHRRSSEVLKDLKDTRVYEYIMSVVSLTTDDLCSFDKPLYYTGTKTQKVAVVRGLDLLTDAVSKWLPSICYDLLTDGFSIYTYKTITSANTTNFVLLPYKDPVSIFYTELGTTNVYTESGDLISNALVFLNFHARFLRPSGNLDKGLYSIEPLGMQLSNFESTAMELLSMQNSVAKLRSQQQYIRFASVDTGFSKGDESQNIVDDVSEGLNANSSSFPFMDGTFDDRIPVFPTRGNIGKVTVESYAPSADTTQLADVSEVRSQLAATFRFPESYSNFKEAIGSTATSLIRQDIRYSRLLDRVRAVIENTINEWVLSVPSLSGVRFKMNRLPSPEDSDSITSLNSSMSFVDSVSGSLESCTSKEQLVGMVASLRSLFNAPSSSVDDFLSLMKDVYMDRLEVPEGSEDSTGSFGGDFPADIPDMPDLDLD